jgi:4-aminobutyrate aminotransferase-like enzyme
MAGLEVVANRETKEGDIDLGAAIGKKMTENGLWAQLATMASFGGVFRLAPPLTTTDEELLAGLDIIEEAFASTPGTKPLYKRDSGADLKVTL